MTTKPEKYHQEGEEAYEDGEGAQMGLLEHLDELRIRLTKAVLALAISTTLTGFLFTDPLLDYLISPVNTGGESFKLQTLGPTESVIVYFKVALIAGVVFAIPFVIWQLAGFIQPALKENEKDMILRSIPFAVLFFMVGVAFAWFIMAPTALQFLREFQSDVFFNEWTADNYLGFITSLLFWIGLSFETPLLFYLLAKMGLVTAEGLRSQWRLAVVAVSVVAAMITPTVDPFNMGLVMGPLLGLYVLSILAVKIAYPEELKEE